MRRVLALLIVLAVSPASARDACSDLIERVRAATGAEVADRNADFARFDAGPQTALTLSCAGEQSSVGAQYKGETVPAEYDALFARAGHAVTGIAPDRLREAAREARDGAQAKRHSTIDVGGARVTCAVMRRDQGVLTQCALLPRPGA